jgi:hypothetical protein
MFIDPMSVGALFNNHWYSQIRCVGQFSILYRVGDGIICPIDEPELIIEVKDAILIDPVMDLSTCDFFVLRQITGSNTQFANYFLQPQGMGSMLQSGDRIKSSIRIYLYGQQNRFLQ